MEVHYPTRPCGTGVLVLTGSSGRVDTQRAALLARHGAVALPLQWFGGERQQPGCWEVPIETFIHALDVLAVEVDRLTILGVSFGAEAAVVTAVIDQRVSSVAAFAPTSVVWAGYDPDRDRQASHWTLNNEPLPYLPIIASRSSSDDGSPPSYLTTYEHSMSVASGSEHARATIAVEKIPDVLVVTGGDDQVWPSSTFARQIIDRWRQHGWSTRHHHLAEAGHRTLLPGEQPPSTGKAMSRGGPPAADAPTGLDLTRFWLRHSD